MEFTGANMISSLLIARLKTRLSQSVERCGLNEENPVGAIEVRKFPKEDLS